MSYQEVKEEYLKKKGYTHKETEEETYKCQPYQESAARHPRFVPKPDPEGTAEFTLKKTVEKVDELTDGEATFISAMEQEKAVKELEELLSEHLAATKTIQNIMVFFAILCAVGVIASLVSVIKMASILA